VAIIETATVVVVIKPSQFKGKVAVIVTFIVAVAKIFQLFHRSFTTTAERGWTTKIATRTVIAAQREEEISFQREKMAS